MALTQVKSDGIATGAVTAEQIAANAVTVDDIADGSISTAKLADDAVTADKLADTAVTAGSYGSASAIPAITVDAQGRITAASTNAINIDSTAITNGTSNVSVADSGDITATRAGSTKLTVNSTGIDVTGSVTCDGLTSDGQITAGVTGGAALVIKDTDSTGSGSVVYLEGQASNGSQSWYLGQNSGSNNNVRLFNNSAANLEFGTNAGVKVVIESAGHFRSDANGTLDCGTSSYRWRNINTNGILFNGDTAAANKLDDYEEGTWTPTFQYQSGGSWFDVGFANSLDHSSGSYVKIGNLVYFSYYSGNFQLTSASQGADARITGLPYTSYNDAGTYSGVIFYHTNPFQQTITNGYVEIGQNVLYPVQNNSTSRATWGTTSSRYLMVSGTYRTP